MSCDPAPGFGGILLGGIVAEFAGGIDPDLLPDLRSLTRDLEEGRRVAQPCLRHRLQVDTIGLDPVIHRLVGEGERLSFEFGGNGGPEHQVLGAVYFAGNLPVAVRRPVMATIRRAIDWPGPVGADLIASLGGVRSSGAFARSALENPMAWALDRLGFDRSDPDTRLVPGQAPPARLVQRRYRELLRAVHPDHGGTTEGAAQQIAELTEARRILIGR